VPDQNLRDKIQPRLPRQIRWWSEAFAVRVMAAADRMPMLGMNVPGQAPAAVHMAVVVAPPEDPGGEDRAARPDPAPEQVAIPEPGLDCGALREWAPGWPRNFVG
jgi:hypothetical protein